MATPRRKKVGNTPARSTQTPRRNPSKPGMGGANTPKVNNSALKNYFRDNVDPGFWRGNQQQTPIGDNMGVAAALRALGIDNGAMPKGGFGFNADQRGSIIDELQQLQGGLNGENTPNFDWNNAYGIAGNLRNWERQAGVKGGIQPLNATQMQREQFGAAVTPPGRPVVQGGQPLPGGSGGQFPTGPWDPRNHHPGQSPPWNPGQPPIFSHPQAQPAYPQAGQINYGPVGPGPTPPQGYSPGNPHQGPPPDPTQFPGYYSPGHMHEPPYGQQPMQGPPQQAMYGGAQGGMMPPFQGTSPGGSSPGPTAATGNPQQAQMQQNPRQGLGFQQLDLPNWNQFINGYYGELPQQPQYLTGAGLQQQQALMNQLRNNLSGLGSVYGQVAPQYNMAGQRLQTNYGIDREALGGSLANRGIFEGGLADTQFQRQLGDYNRQLQDLNSAAQGQVSDIYSQAGGQFDDVIAQLLALYSQQAQQQAQSGSAPYEAKKRKPPKKDDKKKKAA